MISLAAAAPITLAAFLASAVEAVEAFTIVLAVSVVRGPRPALAGAAAALALLALVVIVFAPLLALVPIHGLQIFIGVLLLVFGLGWLRKAVLRAGGVLALHDEASAFAESRSALQADCAVESKAADWIGGLAAFKAVLLEGTEVVFIVLAVAARPGMLGPAAIGAAAACLTVAALGLMIRHPLTQIPENALKFVVGALLSGFGTFWTAEGLQAPFPLGDIAIPLLIGAYLLTGLLLTWRIRAGLAKAPAWT